MIFLNFQVAIGSELLHHLGSMKLLLTTTAIVFGLIGAAVADIQAPPESHYTSTRKLGRALSNIVYGFIEIPEQIVRKTNDHGSIAGYSYGVVDGSARSLKRLGYGFYELVTFYAPTYKCSYKPPYRNRCGSHGRIEHNVADGLSEFPPELGASQYFKHSRVQSF